MPHKHLAELDQSIESQQSLIGALKTTLKKGLLSLRERFERGDSVDKLVHMHADFIDEVLKRCWLNAIGESTDVSLIAVGGYGRAELHPASDVDVMILIGSESDELNSKLEQLIMLLWDIGLEVGHSVRSINECITEATNDITIATNIMESRHIIGCENLFKTMKDKTAEDQIWSSDAFFNAKCKEQKQRHKKYDNSAYNLEPNLKENPGGLRDIQMIGWVAKRHFGSESMLGLVDADFLTQTEYEALKEGQSLLWRIRYALHLITGRHDDRLLFEHQREIAEQFGYTNNEQNRGVEEFMQIYFQTITELGRLNEMLLQHFQEAILFKDNQAIPVVINKHFQTRNNYLETTNENIFSQSPLALLELFLILQQHHEIEGVSAQTIRLIKEHRHLIDDHFRNDIRSQSLFMEIIRQPEGVTHQFRRMNRYGVLAQYLPVFNNIVGRMQFDLFHIYTVDEHVLMVLRNIRRLSVPEFMDELPLCSEVFKTIPKPEILYIAALFHDIAKGRGGDHADLGAIDTYEFCQQHAFSEHDSKLAAWIVEQHLLMSHIAQRMDIDDPDIIQDFAEKMGDTNRLSYLFLLTVADIRGTNPELWNSWKSTLLNRLYEKTKAHLQRGQNESENLIKLISLKQEESKEILKEYEHSNEEINLLWSSMSFEYFLQNQTSEISWRTHIILSRKDKNKPIIKIKNIELRGCNEIFICMDDAPNVFIHSIGTLDNLGLNILEARVLTTDSGLTINSFFVLEENGELIEDEERSSKIIESLTKNLSSDKDYEKYGQRRTSRQMKQFNQEPQIVFEQDTEHDKTIVQISAIDSPGLLFAIGQAFEEEQALIHNAKITTVGELAKDHFHISGKDNLPIIDNEKLEQLKKTIIDKLSE